MDTRDDIFKTYINWLPMAGKIMRIAWGKIISLISWSLFKPIDFAASFWPTEIDWSPALNISASKAESLSESDIIPAANAPIVKPKTTGNP